MKNEKIRIALIEDNPTDILTLTKQMEHTGILEVTHTYVNGSDFLLAVSENKVDIDIAIIDYRMPVLNGLETFRNLNYKNVPFKMLLVSHGYYSQVMREVLQMGCQNYCRKNIESIMTALPRLMDGYNVYEDLEQIHNWEGDSKTSALQQKDEQYWKSVLSPLDKKIIQFICCGFNSGQIAKILGYETSSIEKYRGQILQNLSLNNSQQLTGWAVANGLVISSFLYEASQSSSWQDWLDKQPKKPRRPAKKKKAG